MFAILWDMLGIPSTLSSARGGVTQSKPGGTAAAVHGGCGAAAVPQPTRCCCPDWPSLLSRPHIQCDPCPRVQGPATLPRSPPIPSPQPGLLDAAVARHQRQPHGALFNLGILWVEPSFHYAHVAAGGRKSSIESGWFGDLHGSHDAVPHLFWGGGSTAALHGVPVPRVLFT